MTLLYYDPVFLEHDTGHHSECANRIIPVVRHLNFVALDAKCRRPTWKPVSLERLAPVHSPSYVENVKVFAESGGGLIEADTVVSRRSYDVALMAAGAVCDAVERVVRGEDDHAFCPGASPRPSRTRAGSDGFLSLQ